MRPVAGSKRLARNNAQYYPPLLDTVHKATHHRVIIEQRVDRELLLSVKEQSRQVLMLRVLMLRVDKFGDLPGCQPCKVPSDTKALQDCYKFMFPFVNHWVQDLYKSVAEMKRHFKVALKENGLNRAPTAFAKANAALEARGEPKQTDRRRMRVKASPKKAPATENPPDECPPPQVAAVPPATDKPPAEAPATDKSPSPEPVRAKRGCKPRPKPTAKRQKAGGPAESSALSPVRNSAQDPEIPRMSFWDDEVDQTILHMSHEDVLRDLITAELA